MFAARLARVQLPRIDQIISKVLSSLGHDSCSTVPFSCAKEIAASQRHIPMDLLQFAVATIIQPSAWLFFGFGLILLTAASRRLLCLFKRWRHPEPRILSALRRTSATLGSRE